MGSSSSADPRSPAEATPPSAVPALPPPAAAPAVPALPPPAAAPAVPALPPPAAIPANPTLPDHPPYDEMICTAIATLNKTNGSTKKAIAKCMEETYDGLSYVDPDLLTGHLNFLVRNGRLYMVKNSYKLSEGDASLPTAQRKRGRPPKRKLNADAQPQPLPEDEPASTQSTRRPGRPPKAMMNVVDQAGQSKRSGLSPKPPSQSALSTGDKRRRGRPPKHQTNINVVPFAPLSLSAPAYAVPPSGAAQQEVGAGSREGRTPHYAAKKSAVGPTKVTSFKEELRRKLEHFQSKVNESVRVIKPHFTIDSPVSVISAIQELERLATMDLEGPLTNGA